MLLISQTCLATIANQDMDTPLEDTLKIACAGRAVLAVALTGCVTGCIRL